MPAEQPHFLLAAITSRRYLISEWPWRALFSVLTALPVVGIAALLLTPVTVVGTAAIVKLTGAGLHGPTLLSLAGLATFTLAAFGTLLAAPFAAVERRRLGIVDPRPLEPVPRADSVASWIGARYADAASWRELLFLVLLGTVAPVVYGTLAFATFITGTLIISPLLVPRELDGGPVTITMGPWQADTPAQAIPFALLGLALLPVLAYLTGLLAAGHAATARALLGGTGQAELREVARSRTRLVDAFDAERRRIERDLHDGAQHRLTSLTLQLGVARLDLADDTPAAAALDRATTEAKDLMVLLRDLVHGISPQTLADLGLPAALRDLAERSPLDVTVTVAPQVADRYPARVENTAYFVASEALGNVAKHARTGAAAIRLARHGDLLVVEVRDEGAGGADPMRGTGLTGLADRVAAVGGRLLLSSPAGGPTLVRVELPCLS
ncbi:histidine kinase [Catellatospora methionotrophica]|uniref:histidine kinase n=1 Tax=Catellatospora methionotrophica TaxID=121620 RepID=A0A8J3LL29_9ACTN|nr:sensor domain-containing protein [Catellatospora methionotrophica]GIG17121.1 histidine kinase [Catellatospora methionotrophica]